MMFPILKPRHAVTIDPQIVIFTVFFLLGLYFFFYIRSIVILVFLSFVLMTALRPGVNFLHKKFRLPYPLSILLVYSLVVTLLALAIGLIVPPLANELQKLLSSNGVPLFEPIQAELRAFKFSLNELGNLINSLGSSFSTALAVASSAFNSVFTFFTLIVLSFYMLLDRDNLYKRVAWFTKDEHHLDLAKKFVDRVELQLGGWVRGQSILMIVIGLVTYVGLIILGVPYALPLALLAGLLEVLPNLGPTIAAIPSIILAFFAGGGLLAGLTTLFYVLIQQLENNLIVPKIMKDNVDVSPLATIVTILIGLKMAGVIGALLSVPVYILLRTLYYMWLRENHH